MKYIITIRNWLFLTLLVVLPFGLRHIFNYGAVSNVEGFRGNISWSIYAFDLVFILLIIFYAAAIPRSPLKSDAWKKIFKNPFFWLATVFLISTLFSSGQPVAFYNSLRIFEAIIIFLIAKDLFEEKTLFIRSCYLIFLGGAVQSIIGLCQFAFQKSIGLKFLGESIISPATLGVAKFETATEKIIRIYGTFPHPNLLGAFLLFSLVCGLWLLIFNKERIFPTIFNLKLSGKVREIFRKIHFFAGLFLITSGIFLTFSRSVWLATFLVIIFIVFKFRISIRQKLSSRKFLLVFLVAIVFLLAYFSLPRLNFGDCFNDKSYTLRKTYRQAATEMIWKNPMFGIGPGNFVEQLKTKNNLALQVWEIQPVHNFYLLIISEVGLLGFCVLVFFIISNIPRTRKDLLFTSLFFSFLLLGFLDHYFWTLAQGQIIFWLALAFYAASAKMKRAFEK